ncbi:MAG TPA: FtsH protease activity modulator HflK [Nitrospirae bacterium]|nr:FtsH protease activity modulator HflK [Nitrospirota bacterium]
MGWEDRPRRPKGGSGGFDKMPEFDLSKFKPPTIKPGHFLIIIPVIVGLWLLTGLYKVDLQEQGVVLVFGKHTANTVPGLHWNIPPPFGKVIKVRTEEIKRIEIGFRTEASRMSRQSLTKESIMLTEGANMIDIHMSVQYRVKDPAQFLFGVADSFRALRDRGLYETVKNVAEASLREVVGKNNIDDILTVGKSQIQQDIHDQMQKVLNLYDAGLTVNLVQLQDVRPPKEVRESFRDVNNSEEDKNRLIREAEGYSNSVIPEARGKAAQIIAKAEAYREQRISLSKGDANRFLAQLFEYRKAPGITRKRLYIETMEEVFSKMDKIIIDKKAMNSILPLLPLGGLLPSGVK